MSKNKTKMEKCQDRDKRYEELDWSGPFRTASIEPFRCKRKDCHNFEFCQNGKTPKNYITRGDLTVALVFDDEGGGKSISVTCANFRKEKNEDVNAV